DRLVAGPAFENPTALAAQAVGRGIPLAVSLAGKQRINTGAQPGPGPHESRGQLSRERESAPAFETRWLELVSFDQKCMPSICNAPTSHQRMTMARCEDGTLAAELSARSRKQCIPL